MATCGKSERAISTIVKISVDCNNKHVENRWSFEVNPATCGSEVRFRLFNLPNKTDPGITNKKIWIFKRHCQFLLINLL